MTRCKAVCRSVTRRVWGKDQLIFEAELEPVHGGSRENEEFFAATPSGSIKLGILRADNFVPGKSYYVDFTEAEA